ncbi:MAG: archease [Nitrososphaeraceae archaeon]|jgi:protein archease
MSSAEFRYIEHVSDAMVEAYGRTLGEAFAHSARALVNLVCNVSKVDPHKIVSIETTGFDRKSLLYNWLEKVLLVLLIDNIILAKFEVKIKRHKDKYHLFSTCKGDNFLRQKHEYKVEVKAITYHGMKISDKKGKVIIRFLVDL